MATCICIGDPHFQISNIPEVEKFVDRCLSLTEERNPDFCVILGDILHTHERLHTTALNNAYDFIRRMSLITKTFVLVGNHDMINNSVFLEDKHWMNGMKSWDNVIIVDDVHIENINGHTFTFCPYVPPGRLTEALDTKHRENWINSSCIFAHQEFKGCKMGCIISEIGDEWNISLPNVISGHIHSNQEIDNVYYPGSAMQHAFGESEFNVIPYIEFQEHSYIKEEMNLNLPRKKIVYLDIQDFEEYNYTESENKIKLTLSGDNESFKAIKKTKKYKDLLGKGVKIVCKPNCKLETEELDDTQTESDFQNILKSVLIKKKKELNKSSAKKLVEYYKQFCT